MKVWIDTSVGSSALSDDFYLYMVEEKDWELVNRDNRDREEDEPKIIKDTEWDDYYFNSLWIGEKKIKTHPEIIEALEELGEDAVKDRYTFNESGERGIHIIEVPDDLDFYIGESEDGSE